MLIPATVYAQAAIESAIFAFSLRNFFVAVISGLILAFAFQLLLANASAAAGLNILGAATSPEKAQSGEGSGQGGSGGAQSTIRAISAGFGIWALITSSVSLFFASWFAVRLSLVQSFTAGAILGLVIWGLFYITTMTIEASAASSLVGALAGLVKNGMRAASEAASSVFKASPEQRLEASVSRITESVREELFGSRQDFKDQLSRYINQVKPPQMKPEDIARGIANVLSDAEIKTVTTNEGRENVVSFLLKEGKLEKEQAQAVASGIQSAYGKAKEEAGSGKDATSKVADTVMRAAGVPQKESEAYRSRMENYLRSTGKQQLNPDGIKRDIEKLIQDPKAGVDALKARVSNLDKSSMIALLEQRKDMSHDEAQRVVDRVDQVLKEITGTVQGKAQSAADSVTSKIRNYLDSLQQPELSYEGIKNDIQKLVHDPKEGAEALINRLRSMDRDTLKSLIASRKDISDKDAEQILRRIESTRDELMQKAEQMKDKVAQKLEEAKVEAVRQIDETRKTATVAAWWVFTASVVSGIAAVLGGLLGVTPF